MQIAHSSSSMLPSPVSTRNPKPVHFSYIGHVSSPLLTARYRWVRFVAAAFCMVLFLSSPLILSSESAPVKSNHEALFSSAMSASAVDFSSSSPEMETSTVLAHTGSRDFGDESVRDYQLGDNLETVESLTDNETEVEEEAEIDDITRVRRTQKWEKWVQLMQTRAAESSFSELCDSVPFKIFVEPVPDALRQFRGHDCSVPTLTFPSYPSSFRQFASDNSYQANAILSETQFLPILQRNCPRVFTQNPNVANLFFIDHCTDTLLTKITKEIRQRVNIGEIPVQDGNRMMSRIKRDLKMNYLRPVVSKSQIYPERMHLMLYDGGRCELSSILSNDVTGTGRDASDPIDSITNVIFLRHFVPKDWDNANCYHPNLDIIIPRFTRDVWDTQATIPSIATKDILAFSADDFEQPGGSYGGRIKSELWGNFGPTAISRPPKSTSDLQTSESMERTKEEAASTEESSPMFKPIIDRESSNVKRSEQTVYQSTKQDSVLYDDLNVADAQKPSELSDALNIDIGTEATDKNSVNLPTEIVLLNNPISETTHVSYLSRAIFGISTPGDTLEFPYINRILSVGSIPVFIGDDALPPLWRTTPWSEFSISIKMFHAKMVDYILYHINSNQILEMQSKIKHAFRRMNWKEHDGKFVLMGILTELWMILENNEGPYSKKEFWNPSDL